MWLNENYSKVQTGTHLSDTFPVKNGLKQGHASLPLFFGFASEYAMKNI
jgi:hypothetical protein